MNVKEKNRPIGWTTLEESKKLVKAGFDPNTADMYYFEWKRNTRLIRYPKCGTYTKDRDLPCWSLGVLMKNIPLTIENTYNYKLVVDGTDISYENTEMKGGYIKRCQSETLVESAMEMVLWLLENSLIEKR